MQHRGGSILLYVIVMLLVFQGATSILVVVKVDQVKRAVAVQQTNPSVANSDSPEVGGANQGRKVDIKPGSEPTRGRPDAAVTIVEFGDFECPFCATVQPTIKELLQQYPDKVKLAYRDYPISSLHPRAVDASVAARCARDQGSFWEYHDLLYARPSDEKGNGLTSERLVQYAKQLRLDVDSFKSCLEAQKYRDLVTEDFLAGQAYGVSGTPTFFINGVMVSGARPLAEFKTAVERALQAVSQGR